MKIRNRWLTVTSAVAAAGVTGALLLSGAFSSPPQVSPLCTAQAAAQFNAQWQAAIGSADAGNVQNIIDQAIAATAQRAALCSRSGA